MVIICFNIILTTDIETSIPRTLLLHDMTTCTYNPTGRDVFPGLWRLTKRTLPTVTFGRIHETDYLIVAFRSRNVSDRRFGHSARTYYFVLFAIIICLYFLFFRNWYILKRYIITVVRLKKSNYSTRHGFGVTRMWCCVCWGWMRE